MIDKRVFFPATERNVKPIGNVLGLLLESVIRKQGRVLEIASGSGEHAVQFQRRFDSITWQASDIDQKYIDSIHAWRDFYHCSDMVDAIRLDATADAWDCTADALVCINMIHIAPWAACLGLVRNSGRILPKGGAMILYGPFRIQGRMAASNEQFDCSLRQQNSGWGVRDLEHVQKAAWAHGLHLHRLFEMPANNIMIEWIKH